MAVIMVMQAHKSLLVVILAGYIDEGSLTVLCSLGVC